MRKSKPTQAKKGNIAKADSYAEAFKRMDLAIKSGFFIEALAIQEAIISDRLNSYINFSNPDFLKKHKSFGQLVGEWRKQFPEEIKEEVKINLAVSVDAWRRLRNEAVHGIVKSKPGTATRDVNLFLEEAQTAAMMGTDLARIVCEWHKKQKRKTLVAKVQ
jgi:hypothetical protein